MKKITLLLVALAATTFMTGQTVLSHSTDESEFTGGVACADQATGVATDNSFWRSYTPSEFGVTEAMALTTIEFGVGTADFAAAPYTVTVNLYSSDDVFPAGTFTLITTQEVPVVEADAGTKLVVALDEPYNVQPDEEIIIEVMDLDETVNFRIGQNTLGETAPSYLTSEGCGITTPTPTEDIGGGFPDDFIINAVLSPELGVGNNELSQVSVYPNPASDVLNIQTPASVEVKSAAIYDVLGKRSNVSLTNGQINVANLAKGVYILSLDTSAGTLTQKIVKK